MDSVKSAMDANRDLAEQVGSALVDSVELD